MAISSENVLMEAVDVVVEDSVEDIRRPLFRNKMFMLDEMTQQRNASKFAIFYILYQNPKLIFPFFISCYFMFFPNESYGLYRHRPGHLLGGKVKY